MNRYDGLRRMREAKFAAKTTPPTVTKKVTENTYVNRATTNTPISVTPKLKRGRPKTGKASPAQNVPADTAPVGKPPTQRR